MDRHPATILAAGRRFPRPIENYGEWKNQPRWWNRLHGMPGSAGVPLLQGIGTLQSGSPWLYRLRTTPSHTAVLALGLSRVDQPLFGGLLVPVPDALVLLGGDALGVSSVAATWPANVPSGVPVFAQAWVLDAQGPQGLAASNAIGCVAP